jgi:acyl carrier protein
VNLSGDFVDVESKVIKKVQTLLGLGNTLELDENTPLMALGFDSLQAVLFIGELSMC